MARKKGKWWLDEAGNEKPADFRVQVGNFTMQYYREHGILRVAEYKETEEYTGYGAGFTVHMDKLTPDQLDELDTAFGVISELERTFRAMGAVKV